eukprot:1374892-Pyramimonas_sp.AAC.1
MGDTDASAAVCARRSGAQAAPLVQSHGAHARGEHNAGGDLRALWQGQCAVPRGEGERGLLAFDYDLPLRGSPALYSPEA